MSVLLYDAESWVINSTIMNKLDSFHNCCARSITGHHIKLLEDGTWEYPSSIQTLKLAKLLPIKTYIRQEKITASTYVQSTALYKDCKLTSPAAQTFNTPVWWNDTMMTVDQCLKSQYSGEQLAWILRFKTCSLTNLRNFKLFTSTSSGWIKLQLSFF
jgi:hypothetical protein